MASAHRADLERVEIGELGEVTLATVAGRCAARLIDTVAVAAPAAIAATLIWPGNGLLALLLIAAVGIAYDTALVAARGSTPGKALLRLGVVDAETGADPGPLSAGLRAVGHWTLPGAAGIVVYGLLGLLLPDALAGVCAVAAGLLVVVSPLFDEGRRCGLADRAAGTVVLLHPRI
ncbi:RDD family protein [Actinokineospora alba]|uniref:RDD family protein n=1 Tax=Actinokineospora alba TaxID=504798 RepID=A0A1H0K5Q9_9PSEU|nr:RDD family protein [Actinokineospora alba]TDP68038.1 RDD family protein [Actinokineospora alba]SDH91302.1 RDD family protein [Actinokineospora alba]SDO51187.1 RDD family protein [Actinokineospora alba]